MLRLLLPVLFPSWRFFREVAAVPHLEYRLDAGAWRPVVTRPERLGPTVLLVRLFWNSDWNESLFLLSFAERLADEPSEHNAKLLARRFAARIPAEGRVLQFRILFAEGAAPPELAYQSVSMPLESLQA